MSKFLVIMGPKIGDVIATTPLLRNIKKYKPSAEVYVYITTHYGDGIKVLKELGYVDKILYVDESSKISIFKFVLEYRNKFDYIVDTFKSTNKKALFIKLLNARKFSVGFNTCSLCLFYNKLVKYKNEKIVLAESKLLSKIFGIGLRKLDLSLEFPEKLSKKNLLVQSVLGKFKFRITIFVGQKIRSLSDEKWQRLIDLLREKYPHSGIFLIGSNDCMWANIKNFDYDFRKKLSFEESVFLLKKTDLFITSNGGPMWIAAALGTKTIAIHGPSLFAWEPETDNVLNLRPYKYPDCRPCEGRCYLPEYRQFECLNSINLNNIISLIDKFILNLKRQNYHYN